MTNFFKGDGRTPGSWKNIGVGPGSSGWICCPGCGGRISLMGLEINEDGKVDFIKCMYVGCGWGDEIQLDSWKLSQQTPQPTKPKIVNREIDEI